MIPLTLSEAAKVLGVALDPAAGEATVVEIVIDSRAARPGSLFVALGGERVDGHSFVAAAFARGAVAAVTERPVPDAAGLCLVVDDAVRALGRLARHLVDRAAVDGLHVLALTGSQGKTSTKDLLAQVLERVGPTVAPYGNLNNELGVPLTAGRVDEQTRFLVVEMGARGVRHIAYLCEITPPHTGIVLNVGHAHLGEFGSQQAIAVAKGELVEALPADGCAVLNADDPLVWAMRSRTSAALCAFSVRGEPDTERAVWASDISRDELERYRFVLHSKVGDSHARADVELRLSGRHHVANAVAAAAAATAVGVDLELIAESLTAADLRSRSRMEMHERGDDVVVINDAYNSNPDSARAAVDTLAEIGRARRSRSPGARTWALLGDMLELGEAATDEHAALGRYVATAGVDRLVSVGEFASALARGAVQAGLAEKGVTIATGKADATQHLLAHLRPGDSVLVKASRGLALETVAEEIWSAAPAQTPGPDVAESEAPA
ncbi:MAG TPA: UDP-N-acetylmuramoyl-tripeptide--D-alanyl-D-alanine ligase [Propionibacteriaceae bacterium]